MADKKESNIKSLHYTADTNILEITFSNGSTYSYDGVKPESFKAFSEAKSLGTHFHKHIKTAHKATKKEPQK